MFSLVRRGFKAHHGRDSSDISCLHSSKPVCAAPECSIFYVRRLCAECTSLPHVREQLPVEVRPKKRRAEAEARDGG